MNADINDEELGLFQWNSNYGEYVGVFKSSLGKSVDLVLESEDIEPRLFIERVRPTVADLQSREKDVYHTVALKFLDLYNSVWRQGEEITLEKILEVFKLESVHLGKFDTVDLWFSAEDLFTDHELHARLNTQLQLQWSGLEG